MTNVRGKQGKKKREREERGTLYILKGLINLLTNIYWLILINDFEFDPDLNKLFKNALKKSK